MNGSLLIEIGFPALSLLMVVAIGILVSRASTPKTGVVTVIFGTLWGASTLALAATGVLKRFSLPPPALGLFVVGLVLVAVASRAKVGAALMKLPLALLIGFQGFRVFVELLIHQAVVEGIAPPQMSWGGYNLDIVAGATAPIVALAIHRGIAVKPLAVIWNLMGLGLLGTVVVVAVLSMPTALQQLKPDNTWIAYPPYVLLPSILVLTALLLHVAALRKVFRGEVTSAS